MARHGRPASASSRPPGLRREVLFAMWDDEQSAQAFARHTSLPARFAGDGFHAVSGPCAVRVLARTPLGHLPQSRDRSRRSRDCDHARSAADSAKRCGFCAPAVPRERAASPTTGSCGERPRFGRRLSPRCRCGAARTPRPPTRIPTRTPDTHEPSQATPAGLPSRVRLRPLRGDLEHGHAARRATDRVHARPRCSAEGARTSARHHTEPSARRRWRARAPSSASSSEADQPTGTLARHMAGATAGCGTPRGAPRRCVPR